MRKFQFPLDTALKWRQRQLEQEELAMKQRLGELHGVVSALEQLDAERNEADRRLLELPGLTGDDLEALGRYREGAHFREVSLKESKRACEQRAEQQRVQMLEARRKVRLLEKLRERRLAAWQVEFDKDLENLATEVFLAQWPNAQGS